MIILGVDLGVRKVALSVFHDTELTHVAHVEVPSSTRARELRQLQRWFAEYPKVADYVFIEEPLSGRNVRASLRIAQTAGAVMSTLGGTLHERGLKSDFIDNKTWKKSVIGNGNASKEHIKTWLEATYPAYAVLCGSNQDRIDATCIGLYGCQLVERAEHMAAL